MKLMNRSNPSAASAPRSTAWRVGVMVALVSWSAAAQAADRPNIVFIYVDDVSEAALGCYGSVFGPTPHIDRLAEQGVRFTQSFVGNSICGPARATVLTGTHSHVNGRTSNQSEFNRGLPTWPKRLQRGGYQTAMLGKWHLPGEPMGFDYWAITQGYYLDKFNSSDGPATRPGYTTDVLTDLTHEWIAARDPEKPFAVWVNHSAAHRTWMPPPRLLARYDGETLPEPTTLRDDYTGRSAAAYETQMRIARDLFPAYDLKLPVTGEGILDGAARRNLSRLSAEQRAAWDAAYGPKNAAFERADLRGDALVAWKYQRYIKDYLRCVAAIDQSVGATLGFLESAGLADNTVVVFSSDQGFFLGEHGWYDKRWMYEPALRTPLVVRWPGITAPGGTVDAMVQNIDMAPTLIDIAGAEPVDGMQGRSLAPDRKSVV